MFKIKEEIPIRIENAFDVETLKWFETIENGTIKDVAKFKSKDEEIRLETV